VLTPDPAQQLAAEGQAVMVRALRVRWSDVASRLVAHLR
jgi:hypothetical protein